MWISSFEKSLVSSVSPCSDQLSHPIFSSVSTAIKRPELEDDHSLPSGSVDKEVCNYIIFTPLPPPMRLKFLVLVKNNDHTRFTLL
jgi:hypothetical protein